MRQIIRLSSPTAEFQLRIGRDPHSPAYVYHVKPLRVSTLSVWVFRGAAGGTTARRSYSCIMALRGVISRLYPPPHPRYISGMAAARSLIRIAVNVALDGGMAALSVPVAHWLADPAAPPVHPVWTIPLGAAALLLAGIPFRLSLQYWRFAAIGDVITVAASAATGAVLFAAATTLCGVAPGNPAFPFIHTLTLMLLLGTPRVVYRWRRGRPAPKPGYLDTASILLVGSIEDADLFIRALGPGPPPGFPRRRPPGVFRPPDRPPHTRPPHPRIPQRRRHRPGSAAGRRPPTRHAGVRHARVVRGAPRPGRRPGRPVRPAGPPGPSPDRARRPRQAAPG